MKAYRKLIVAVVGIAIMLISKYFGIDATVMEPQFVEAIIGVLTAAGVWKVSNA